MQKIMALGLDVSKRTVDVCFYDSQDTFVIQNNHIGFEKLLERIRDYETVNYVVHACCESTGNYYLALATYLHQHDVKISVVNPLSIKRFGEMNLRRIKTDKQDANLIAEYCLFRQPEIWEPLSDQRMALKSLNRRLDQLINLVVQELNRQQVSAPVCQSSIARIIEFLNEEIQQCKADIQLLINKDKKLKEQQTILATIPGVGLSTASWLLSLLVDIEKFKTSKHLISYLGLSLVIRESGTSVRGGSHLSKMGDKSIRKALYMPARTACTRSKLWHVWFDKKLKDGKKPKQVYVLMMCKILRYSYACLQQNKPFDINLHKRLDA